MVTAVFLLGLWALLLPGLLDLLARLAAVASS
jgi:hypothetical protein